MSRFQHPPQTTGNEADFAAGDRAAGWPKHKFQIRLNCARATFYAYGFPFNVVTNTLRICNGNRTEWSPIQSVIIRVITKSDDRAAGARFVYHEYDYRLNWTTRSPIIN